jgi:hypothetical protein
LERVLAGQRAQLLIGGSGDGIELGRKGLF